MEEKKSYFLLKMYRAKTLEVFFYLGETWKMPVKSLKHISSALQRKKFQDGPLTKAVKDRNRKLIRKLKNDFYYGIQKLLLPNTELDKTYILMRSLEKLLNRV